MDVQIAPPMAAGSSGLNWALAIAAAILVLAAGSYLLGRGRASADSRSGLMLGLRGLLGKELRSRSRGWRPAWILSGYLGMLTLAVTGFLSLMGAAVGVVSPMVGVQLFSALSVGAVLLLAFITPALTVGAVSGERERRTLELLLVTRASPLGLAAGKLVGSLAYVLFLLIASLPAFALVYLYGGVPAIYVAMVLAVAAVTAVAHASLGLLLSALLRRTIVASVVAYLLVLFLVFGLPFFSLVTMVAQQQGRPGMSQFGGSPPAFVYASPMTSVTSVLPAGSPGSGIPLLGDLMRVATGGGGAFGLGVPAPPGPDIAHTVYVASVDQATGQPQLVTRLAPWVYHFAFSGLLASVCLACTALLLAPVKPWRRARRRVMSRSRLLPAITSDSSDE
jgi:ABC-type transport system involved in multi-copper enzyme maturation permease subunit